MAFTLTSTHIADQQTLPLRFVHSAMGAGGQNVSPDLAWSGAPEGTQSYALTMYDPDAPTGSGWWHWVVYDIPASATGLVMGAGAAGGAELPAGAKLGRTDFGTAEYGGAAPPPGATFDGKVLVMAGEASGYVRPEHHAAFRALFPAVTFTTIPKAGHWVHAENPQGFLAALEAFLAR